MSTVFTDAFTRADSDTVGGNWVETSGDWDILSNKLRCVSAEVCLNTTSIGSADYEVEAVVTKNSDSNYSGVVGRAADGSNYYYCIIGGDTVFYVSKRVAGAYINIGSYSSGITGTHTLKLSMQGTTLKGYLDGVERISVTDSAHSAEGDFGCECFGSGDDWDSFAVYDFGAGGATGTGAIAIGGPTLAGTGTSTIVGTGAVGIAGPTLAGTGTPVIVGTGAVAIGGPTLAGTGTGSGAVAISGPTLAGVGTPVIVGTGALGISGPTLAGTGVAGAVSGTGGIAIGGPTLAGVGVVGRGGRPRLGWGGRAPRLGWGGRGTGLERS